LAKIIAFKTQIGQI